MLGALRVPGGETPVEPDGQTHVPLLGERHQPFGVGEFVGERLVDVRRYARLQQPRDDVGVHARRRVHEGGVEVLGEQRVEVLVALPVGKVKTVGDPGQRRRRPRLHVQFDAGPAAEHRQIRLLRDVTESDAADLHEDSSRLSGQGLAGSIRRLRRAPVGDREFAGGEG